VIRRPDFYNTINFATPPSSNSFSNNRGWWIYMQGRLGFGATLTVADTNDDGIDDLVVSDSSYWLPGYTQTTINTGKSYAQGRVYLYYGAKSFGLVAPNAHELIGDHGLGIDTTTASNVMASKVPFALYPMVPTKANSNYDVSGAPVLERITLDNSRSGVSTYGEGYSRRFGVNTSAGDFNGDGQDDLAVTTGYGQVYVYYGPICQLDNDKRIWNEAYKSTNENLAKTLDTSNLNPNHCSKFDLSSVTTASFSASQVTKAMYPQVMSIPGVTTDKNFGALLVSKRPKRSVASKTIVSRPGNIDNDPDGTSDLVIGSAFMQDPNVAQALGTQTGLAYVLFGHKANGAIKSNPGLWYGTPGYTSALLTERCSAGSNEDCFYHQPIYLRGYSADGLVGRFFSYEVSIGDLNGDKSGDLVLPTIDYQNGYKRSNTLESMPLVNGGGLKLVY
jgi:hypothetical protein